MNLTGVLDTFKGFFSRGFWFGNFLPVAIAAAVHGALAAMIFGWDFTGFLHDAIGDKASTTVAVLAAMVALAYMIAPLAPLFGGWVDGSLLWPWLRDGLRAGRAEEWQKKNAAYHRARQALAEAVERRERLTRAMQQARARGGAAPEDPDRAGKEAAIAAADVAVVALDADGRRQQGDSAFPRYGRAPIEAAAALVVAALARNVPAMAADDAGRQQLARLDGLQKQLLDMLRSELRECRHAFEALDRTLEIFDKQGLQATRLGDARHVYRRYVEDSYGVDFDYLWPRVRMVLSDGGDADKGLRLQVGDAAAQVDFAVLLLALTVSVPLVWLPLIAFYHKSMIAFLLIAVLSPPIGRLLFELIVRGEILFGSAVQTAADRYRLDVLKALAMPRPATLSAERQLWKQLVSVAEPDARAELVYAAEKAGK